MDFLHIDYTSKDSILKSFDRIADKFSADIQLKVNDFYYRIVDFEFYGFSANMPDPHTYRHDEQLQAYKLYLHASGLDITFGDGTNHGGILLRSVVRLYDGSDRSMGFMKKQHDGPQRVATEIFSNLKPLNSDGINDIRLVDIAGRNQDHQFYPGIATLKTRRVGLTAKPVDPANNFSDLEIRYIIVLKRHPNFRQTIKGIETILREKRKRGEMTEEKVKEILNYSLK